MRRLRGAGISLTAGLLGATVACGEGSGGPPAPVPGPETSVAPVEGLTAELTQFRRDQADRRLQVRFRHRGDADVLVHRLRLEAPGFGPAEVTVRETLLRPGVLVDLPVLYGEPVCPAPEPDGPTDGTAVVTASVAGAPPSELRVPLSRAGGVLARVRERECRAEAVLSAASISFRADWPEDVVGGRPALLPTLVLERRGGEEPVTVSETAGHVLFSVEPRDGRSAPLAVLGPTDDRVELPLVVVTTRCDAHALAESKRTPIFLLYVALGDDEPRVLPVSAPREVHGQLGDFATRSCRS